ncbi:MAG TPA: NAD(P)-dependent alcohol dehydrogenase [Anaerolineales bacterium]|nr:NAD(P)-dependent alcohol dehydrogenase [Anaerolineales bacterium]
MKAIVQNAYGSPDILEIKDVDNPEVKANDVLVRVSATSINAGDIFSVKGSPWVARFSVGFPKPKDFILGWDAAGTVEAVGEKVTQFKPGDEVYTVGDSAFAEFVCAPEDKVARKPQNLTFEQTAAVPTAALTALLALRNQGKLKEGQKVLINGASGGVGTFSVQIAKALGAQVTGVCSTRNVELVRSLGADHVFDYKKEDFTKSDRRYDLILDNVGSRSFADNRRVLAPQGVHLPNTGHGGMSYVLKAYLLSALMRQHLSPFLAVPSSENMRFLNELIEAGKVKPVIDKVYPMSEAKEAFWYLEKEHAQGKVVLTIQN